MRTLTEIRDEIDRLSDRRVEVMRALAQGYDATLKAGSAAPYTLLASSAVMVSGAAVTVSAPGT